MNTLEHRLGHVEQKPPFRRFKEVNKALLRGEREGFFIRIAGCPAYRFAYLIRRGTVPAMGGPR